MTEETFELVNAQKPELCRSRIAQKNPVITYSLICPRTYVSKIFIFLGHRFINI